MAQKCPNCGSTNIRDTLTGQRCNECGQRVSDDVSADTIVKNTTGGPNFPDEVEAGPFDVERSAYEKAVEAHEERSQMSQERDEDKRARITTDLDLWLSDMDSFDFPGVDTPTTRPQPQEKDKPFLDETLVEKFFD